MPGRSLPTAVACTSSTPRAGADPRCQHDVRLRQGELGDRVVRVLVRRAAGRHPAPLQRWHLRQRRGDQRCQLGRTRSLQRRRHARRDLHAACQQRRLLERVGDARRPHRAGTVGRRADRRAVGALGADPVAGVRPREWRSVRRVRDRRWYSRWDCEARPARGCVAPARAAAAAIDLGAARRRAAFTDRVRTVVCRCGRERRSDRIHGRSDAARATPDPRGARRLGACRRLVGTCADRALGLLGDSGGCRELGAARLRPDGRGHVRPDVRRCAHHGCDSRLGSGRERRLRDRRARVRRRRPLHGVASRRVPAGMARRRPQAPMRSRRRWGRSPHARAGI